MAEDFLPVGIKATVVGVDDFLADLRRMQAGIAKLGEFVKDSAADLRVFGGAAQAVSQSAREFATETNRMAQGARQVNTSVTALNKAVSGLSQKLGSAGPKAQSFSVSLTTTKTTLQSTQNAATRFFNSLSSGFDKMLRGTNIYKNQGKTVSDLKRRYDEAKGSVNQMEKEVEENNQAVSRADQILDKAIATYKRNNQALKKAAQELNRAEAAQKKFIAGGGSAAEAAKRFGGAIGQLRANVRSLSVATFQSHTALDVANARFHAATAAAAKLSGQLAQARASLSALASLLGSAQGKFAAMNAGITLVTGSLRALGAAAAVAVAAFNGLKVAVRAVTAPIRGLNRLFVTAASRVKALNTRLTSLASRAFRVGNSIRFLGTSMTFLITLPIIGFLGSLTKSAIDFEEAWAAVVRTVSDPEMGEGFTLIAEGENDIKNLTEVGENLRQGFRDLALTIPIAAEELARIGEIAGTIGIRGNKNIITFVETIARLGSTTNVTSEDAARALGKLLDVAGTLSEAELGLVGWTEAQIEAASGSEIFQQSALSLGGVLTALGNKTNAFESEILNFAKKIQGVGSVIGLTSAEILGFSSAFIVAGVDAARGGTAFQKVMTGILKATQAGGRELEIFAAVAGQTSQEFVDSFEKDASEALRFFLEGLGQAGKQSIAVLDALALEDARVLASILSLAASGGELTQSLNIVNEELKIQGKSMGELNALLVESERRFSTTKNQLQLLKNQFTDLGITIGDFLLPHINDLVTKVRGIIETISRLHPNVLKFILVMAGLVAIIGPVVTGIGLMLASFGFLFKVIFSAIGLILSLASTLGLAIFPIFALIAAVVGLAIAFAAAFKKIDRFADITLETLVTKMFAFGKNIILAFAKGMAAALTAVVRVLNEIGMVIADWLRPGSPPKLLPDLDKWGAEAMQSYMDGWLLADFDIFNKLADKIERFLRSIADTADKAGRVSLVRAIIGSRRVVAQAVNDIRKFGKVTTGTMNKIAQITKSAGSQFRRYVRAMIDVRIAAEQVRIAQEEVNRIMREYDDALRPIEHRLAQISRRQQDISDRSRIIELEAVLADPRAPEIVRELANLEIEEIGLQTEARQVEELRDSQLFLAETQLAAAELRLEVAEAELDIAEEFIDAIIKENELLQEMKRAAKEAADALKDAADELDLGAIEGFDPDALNLESMFEEDEGLIESLLGDLKVDSIADTISKSFNTLVEDIKKEFDPLFGEGGLFDQLGDTWAPIFDTIIGHIERYLPKAESVLGTIDKWNEGSKKLARTIGGALDFAIRGVSEVLVALGIIEPFGPLLDNAAGSESVITKVQDALGGVRDKIEGTVLWELFSPQVLGVVKGFEAAFVTLRGSLEPLVRAWEDNLKPAIEGFIATISKAGDESNALREFIVGLIGVIGKALGAAFAIAIGITTALVNGFVRAIEFASVFIAGFIDRVAQFISGIIGFFDGLVTFVKGIIELIKGNTEEGASLIEGGFAKMAEGVLNIIEGLVAGFIDLISGLVAAVLGWIAGFVSGIILYFVNLYNELVGNSIITDLVTDVFDLFAEMVNLILEAIAGFVTSLVEEMVEVANAIIDGVQVALDWLVELPGKLFDLGVDAIQGFINGILSMAGNVADSILDIGGDILGGLKGVLGIESPSKEFEEIGEDSMEGWGRGVESNLSRIVKLYEEAADRITKIVASMHEVQNELVSKSLTELMAYVRDWLLDIFDTFLDFGEEYSLDGRQSLWGQILEAVEELWEDHIREMADLASELLDIFEDLLDSVRQQFLSSRNSFREAGANLINSMIDGLNSRVGALLARARQIADQVTSIINRAFESGSPSQVFLDIGKNLIESWAMGMESAEQGLLTAVSGIASQLASQQAIQPALAEGAFRQAAQPAASQTTVNREVNIDLGGQQINNGMDSFELQLLIEQAVRNVL
jgi:TP901 family phage tail tape measure protein